MLLVLFSIGSLLKVEHAASGGSSCVFAYGATGSGKTYLVAVSVLGFRAHLNPE